MNRLIKQLLRLIRPWVAAAVIKGFFPEKIGRYRVLDILVFWGEQDLKA
jgi:hypothetical protein